MKLYIINDRKVLQELFENGENILKDYKPVMETNEALEVLQIYYIDGKPYTVYTCTMSNAKNPWAVLHEIELEESVGNECVEDLIKCPICGHEDIDSWEYQDDYVTDYQCGQCGSILSFEKEYTITYTTKVRKRRKPINLR